jgi:DNA-binding FadR family transcriptional regulator
VNRPPPTPSSRSPSSRSPSSRGLVGELATAVGRRITTGMLLPGELLDPEALAAEFGTSRTVVREALKVLGAKGLIESRPHVGTSVRPRREWRLADPEVMAWRTAQGTDLRLIGEIDEVRGAIEPLGARLAAERADPEACRQVREAMDRLRAASDRPGGAEWVSADLALHRAILEAGGNELLASLEGLLEPGLRARDLLVGAGGDPLAAVDAHEAVVVAIERRRPDAAERAMRRLMRTAASEVREISRVIEVIQAPQRRG